MQRNDRERRGGTKPIHFTLQKTDGDANHEIDTHKEVINMSKDYLPARDLELNEWLENFIAVAGANLAALGLTNAEVNSVSIAQVSFEGNLADVNTAKKNYESAVEAKNTGKRVAVNLVRPLVKRIQAKAGVSNALKAQLGITVRDTEPTPIEPVPPVNLIVTGLPSGTNALDWKRGGNAPGTQFVVEYRMSDSNQWQMADVVTRTRYQHTNQRPGIAMVYRVRARRGTQVSEPSNEATVYAEWQEAA